MFHEFPSCKLAARFSAFLDVLEEAFEANE